MARDAVALTTLALDAVTNTPAGVAINPANGANIAKPTSTRKMTVRLTNTAGADHIVTFRAGVYPPGFQSQKGDLVVTVPATTGDVMLNIDSARFAQADGTINVDFETGMTGKISAIMRSPYA